MSKAHCGCGDYSVDISVRCELYEFGAICPECGNHFGWNYDPSEKADKEDQ